MAALGAGAEAAPARGGTGEGFSEGGGARSPFYSCEGDHKKWACEAFLVLVGQEGRLTSEKICGRPFAAWFRSFIVNMTVRGDIPPSKAIRTSRIVALLAAKAAENESGGLSFEEFDACLRVLTCPSQGCALEEELTWTLLHVEDRCQMHSGDAVKKVRALWASLGISCSEEDARGVAAAAEEHDQGRLTAKRYHEWFLGCSRGAPRAPSLEGPRWRAASARGCGAGDQLLRSAEARRLALFGYGGDRPLDLSEHVRCPTPAHGPRRARGRGTPEGGATPRGPRRPAAIDWQAQERWWTQKSKRLLPYMRVKASYTGHDGVKVDAIGTLLTGWGLPNKAAVLPHAKPPDGARLRGISAQAAQPGVAEATNRNDIEHFVVVLINGVERTVPRECVSPLGES